MSENVPLDTFLGLRKDRGQRKTPKKMESGRELHRILLLRTLFEVKNDSQGSFMTRREPLEHKQLKNSVFF